MDLNQQFRLCDKKAVFAFLLVLRWFFLACVLRFFVLQGTFIEPLNYGVLLLAMVYALSLTLFRSNIERRLSRNPKIVGIDIIPTAVFLILGGWPKAWFLYSLTPIAATALFWGPIPAFLVTAPLALVRFFGVAYKFPSYPGINPENFFDSLRAIFRPFSNDYLLLLQILIRALAAFAISYAYQNTKNKLVGRIMGVVLGGLVLIIGYASTPPLLHVPSKIISTVAGRLIVLIFIGLLLSVILEAGNIERFRFTKTMQPSCV